jgi:hypothetical protein
LEREELEFVAMVAQRIWFSRNRYVFYGIVTQPNFLIKSAKEALEEYRKALDSMYLFSSPSPISSPAHWFKPPHGFFKLNWDAALDRNQKWMGVGIVSRDSYGKVIASKCSCHHYISNPLVAETFGAKLCVEFGISLGFKSVVIEGDAVGVVSALNQVVVDEGIATNLIAETRVLLENFDRWTIKHVRREGNKIAHSLAKLVISQLQNRVWLGSFPSVLSDLVNSEMYS